MLPVSVQKPTDILDYHNNAAVSPPIGISETYQVGQRTDPV
jgi:hypothetical protein